MKKVADAGSEQVKKPTDTKKLDGSVLSRSQKDEVSDSESMLSEDDDFWTGIPLKPFVHAQTMKIARDGNSLFQAISDGIGNSEQYHAHVRREICNFIETYDKDLKLFIKKGKGKTYIEGGGT